MTYDYIYWPLALPRKALLDSFSPRASASVLRTATDAGVPLQRGMGDYPLDPVSCAYIMTRAQVASFQNFCRMHAGRSFWMPYPDPLHAGYAKDKWWYARISPQDQHSAATISAEGNGAFRVALNLEFWVGVPGIAAPAGGE